MHEIRQKDGTIRIVLDHGDLEKAQKSNNDDLKMCLLVLSIRGLTYNPDDLTEVGVRNDIFNCARAAGIDCTGVVKLT